MRRLIQGILTSAGLLLVLACGGGGGGGSTPALPTPTPTIISFTPAQGTIQKGTSTTITGVFTNGLGSINNGVGNVQSGVSISSGTLQSTTTFTLSVTGIGGNATAQTTITVPPDPVITSFSVTNTSVAYNGSTTLTAVFANGTGTVDQGVGTVQSGVPVNIGPLTVSNTYTLTVANQFTNTTSQVVVTVLPAPPLIITSNPSSAPIGSRVELAGSNLTGVTDVRFGGISAAFSIESSVRIVTAVPGGASTGVLTVIGPGGTWTSTAPFTVLLGNAAGQLILDPGFELGSSAWNQFASIPGPVAVTDPFRAHSGVKLAWMNGYGVANTATLYQTVILPSDAAQITLSFFLKVETAETISAVFDTLQVQVRNSSGSLLQTLWTYSNLDASGGSLQRSFDLTAYKGQTIRLHFLGLENSTNTTSFYLDDINLNYTRGGVPLDLSIEGMHLTQVTQRFDGAIPLVKDRDAFVRVFVKANLPNSAVATVRVKFINTSGTQIITIPSASSSVTTTINEASGVSNWNAAVPGAWIQPGLQVLAELDPGNTIQEATRDNNVFPANGVPLAQDVRTLQPFRVTLVPVLQSLNGRLGDVTNANLETWLSHARKVYPLASGSAAIDATVRATYTTSVAVSAGYDGTWTTMLNEIAALRTAETANRYYFGALKLDYSGGFGTGVAGVPSQSAIGVDSTANNQFNQTLTNRAGTFAHELGHCMGLMHAPCGTPLPASIDPNYPYQSAMIGVPGTDPSSGTLYAPFLTDLMAYCGYNWISDYHYFKLLLRREQFPNGSAQPISTDSTGAKEPLFLVWGRRQWGQMIIEPVFEIQAVSNAPEEGDHHLQITNILGEFITVPFSLAKVEDIDDPSAAIFAFTVPTSRLRGLTLQSLDITKNGESLARVDLSHLPTRAQNQAPLELLEWGADKVYLSWDSSAYPVVMVRDSKTGEILSFARGGSILLPTMAEEFELVLSSGLNSEMRHIHLPLKMRSAPPNP